MHPVQRHRRPTMNSRSKSSTAALFAQVAVPIGEVKTPPYNSERNSCIIVEPYMASPFFLQRPRVARATANPTERLDSVENTHLFALCSVSAMSRPVRKSAPWGSLVRPSLRRYAEKEEEDDGIANSREAQRSAMRMLAPTTPDVDSDSDSEHATVRDYLVTEHAACLPTHVSIPDPEDLMRRKVEQDEQRKAVVNAKVTSLHWAVLQSMQDLKHFSVCEGVRQIKITLPVCSADVTLQLESKLTATFEHNAHWRLIYQRHSLTFRSRVDEARVSASLVPVST
jgi:hypothetical protein